MSFSGRSESGMWRETQSWFSRRESVEYEYDDMSMDWMRLAGTENRK